MPVKIKKSGSIIVKKLYWCELGESRKFLKKNHHSGGIIKKVGSF
jgi:hypothetical protein